MQGGDRWGVSAPEAYVLLHGPERARQPESEAFRLALVELWARGWISGSAGEGEPAETSGSRLVRGDSDFAPRDRALVAALAVFESALSEAGDPGEGVPAEYVFARARERYGDLAAYLEEEVLPSLEERGYYERADDRILWVIPRKRWRETGAGKRVREDLERTAEEAGGLPELARRDPEGARSFVRGAGPVLLMMPFLYPDVAGLSGAGLAGSEGEAIDPSAFEGLSGLPEGLSGALPGGLDDRLGAPGDAGDGGIFGGDGGGFGGGDI